jgi:hypothetical protein
MIRAVLECCAGIDVGKKFVVVCVMTGPAEGEAQEQTRKYGTNERRSRTTARLVAGLWMYTRRHGEHGVVFGSHLQCIGDGGRDGGGISQFAAGQEPARPQDGSQRQPLAGSPAPARHDFGPVTSRHG